MSQAPLLQLSDQSPRVYVRRNGVLVAVSAYDIRLAQEFVHEGHLYQLVTDRQRYYKVATGAIFRCRDHWFCRDSTQLRHCPQLTPDVPLGSVRGSWRYGEIDWNDFVDVLEWKDRGPT